MLILLPRLTYDLNLKTQVAVSNLIIDPNTKIVLVGTIQPFVQMYFITDNERPEDNITEEEKELVLEYLQDKDNAWGKQNTFCCINGRIWVDG